MPAVALRKYYSMTRRIRLLTFYLIPYMHPIELMLAFRQFPSSELRGNHRVRGTYVPQTVQTVVLFSTSCYVSTMVGWYVLVSTRQGHRGR